MIAKAKADLLALLNDEGNLTLEQKEEELARIKALNIQDAEIQDLIKQVEEKLAKERATANIVEEEEVPVKANEVAKTTELSDYFDQIASTGDVSTANKTIDQALAMFASPDVPVLIIINRSGGNVDYDRPTDIKKYLNYLKDQDKNINAIENLAFNDNGKITEVELIRKYEK
jgi:altronate dehydratase